MTRVLVVGACGRMGQSLVRQIASADGLELGAALEHAAHPSLGQEVCRGVLLGSDMRAASPRPRRHRRCSTRPSHRAFRW
jgi:dihydrodipicolinate reductase